MKNENKKIKSNTKKTAPSVKKSYRVKCREYDAFGRGIVSFNGSKIPVANLLRGEMAHMTLSIQKPKLSAV